MRHVFILSVCVFVLLGCGKASNAATSVGLSPEKVQVSAKKGNGMDNNRLGILIEEHGSEIEGQPGFWKFQHNDRVVYVITDEFNDRMRIMSPVAAESDLPIESLRIALSANFDRALDARYALNDEVLWSVYLHPLQRLDGEQFLDGLNQVCRLADNFGSTYASSDLVFGEE